MSASTASPPRVVIGGAMFGSVPVDPLARFDTPDEVNAVLQAFAKKGHNEIDTSRMYGSSEDRLGAASTDGFLIDTKIMSNPPGMVLDGIHRKEKVASEIDASLKALRTDKVHIEYLHTPDRTTAFEETCEAMSKAYEDGKFEKWGLGSYMLEEVKEILAICEEHGWVKPSVYQGHYNAITRGAEKDLLPLLRGHGIAFYAYSPAAGGFFAGNHKERRKGGRFDTSSGPGWLYSSYFMKPSIIDAAEKAVESAAGHGIGGHAVALRWIMHHSQLSGDHGDAIIMAGSTMEQLEMNLDILEQGPLPSEVVAAMEAVQQEIGPDDVVPHHL